MMLLANNGIPFRELSSSYFVLYKFVELIVIGFRAFLTAVSSIYMPG